MAINYGDRGNNVGQLQSILGVKSDKIFGKDTATALIATPQVQNAITNIMTQSTTVDPPPPNGPIYLIDTYHDDDVNSWSSILQGGFVGAIQKTTQALSADPKFLSRYLQALANGLKAGGYHFCGFGYPVQEADFFISQLQAVGYTPTRDINPAIDWEYADGHNPSSSDIAFVKAFISEIKAKLGIKRVIIYASDYLFQYLLSIGETFYQAEILWVAKYSSNQPQTPYTLWQQTGNGAVPGLNNGDAQSDVSYFAGNTVEFMALMG